MKGFVDISGFIEQAVPVYDPEQWDFAIAGLKPIGPISISGTWDTGSIIPALAVKVVLSGVKRLPRKTKKALKKHWTGGFLSAREHRRLIASIGR